MESDFIENMEPPPHETSDEVDASFSIKYGDTEMSDSDSD